MTNHIDLADELLLLQADKNHYEALVTDINKEIARVELSLAELMVEQDLPFFGHAGKRFGVDSQTLVTPAGKEFTQDVVDWIAANGGEYLMKPAMHHARRNKFLQELFLDDDDCELPLPEELVDKVKFTTLPRVSVRKA